MHFFACRLHTLSVALKVRRMFIRFMKCLSRTESSDMINVKSEPLFTNNINRKCLFILLYSKVNRGLLKKTVHPKICLHLLTLMLFQTFMTLEHKIHFERCFFFSLGSFSHWCCFAPHWLILWTKTSSYLLQVIYFSFGWTEPSHYIHTVNSLKIK